MDRRGVLDRESFGPELQSEAFELNPVLIRTRATQERSSSFVHVVLVLAICTGERFSLPLHFFFFYSKAAVIPHRNEKLLQTFPCLV